MKFATPKGSYRGKKFYNVPVKVTFNNSAGTVADWCNPPTLEFTVLAPNAAAAANWAADQYRGIAETEVVAYGPKGGETHRFIGWESAIGHALLERQPKQLSI